MTNQIMSVWTDEDARLLASAPEMLRALEYIAQFTPEAIALNPLPIKKRAEAAIRIARGEEKC